MSTPPSRSRTASATARQPSSVVRSAPTNRVSGIVSGRERAVVSTCAVIDEHHGRPVVPDDDIFQVGDQLADARLDLDKPGIVGALAHMKAHGGAVDAGHSLIVIVPQRLRLWLNSGHADNATRHYSVVLER